MNAIRLRQLMLDAVEHVPFYRHHWRAAGVDLTRIGSAVHLNFLPLVRREDLLACPPEMRIDQRLLDRRTRIDPTSDLSRQPFELPIDHDAIRRRRRRFAHALRDVGYVFGEKVMLIADPPFPMAAAFMRWTYVDINRGEADLFATYARKRPHVLYGPLSSLLALARRMLTSSEVQWRPKLVVSTAEQLSDAQRTLLESAFSARVADFYSTPELGLVAYSKPGISGYRVLTKEFHVETLREGGSAGMERLVVTDLDSGAMPLIRFDTGDRVCRDAARAGAIVQVTGREAPRVVTGGYVAPQDEARPLELDGMDGLHAA